MKLKLKIHLKQEKNILYGWIEEQDEGLRNKKWLRSTVILDKSNFRIISFQSPGLTPETLYIRGKKSHNDNRAFCLEFNSSNEAYTFAIMLGHMIDEVNGIDTENISKDWSTKENE